MNQIDFFRPNLLTTPTPWRALALCCAIGASGLAAAQLHNQARTATERHTQEAQQAIARLAALEPPATTAASDNQPIPKKVTGAESQLKTLQSAALALGLHRSAEPSVSGVLTALASADTPSLWLTSIHVAPESSLLKLAGQAHTASDISHWLAGLRDQPMLRTVSKESLQIETTDRDQAAFKLELHVGGNS